MNYWNFENHFLCIILGTGKQHDSSHSLEVGTKTH